MNYLRLSETHGRPVILFLHVLAQGSVRPRSIPHRVTSSWGAPRRRDRRGPRSYEPIPSRSLAPPDCWLGSRTVPKPVSAENANATRVRWTTLLQSMLWTNAMCHPWSSPCRHPHHQQSFWAFPLQFKACCCSIVFLHHPEYERESTKRRSASPTMQACARTWRRWTSGTDRSLGTGAPRPLAWCPAAPLQDPRPPRPSLHFASRGPPPSGGFSELRVGSSNLVTAKYCMAPFWTLTRLLSLS